MSYDDKCQELAEYFLPAGADFATIQALAQQVQDCIEEFLRERLATETR